MKLEYVLAVFLGGGLGSVFRYILSYYTNLTFNIVFPIGTLVVNSIGSFLIGFLGYLFEIAIISSEIRVFLTIGVMGGFTTFSTFSLENFNLLRDGEIKLFLINVSLSVLLGVMFVIVGHSLGEIIFRRKV
ncbi:MAG: fluoride efflux transporter CrcB [Brevinematales bacterium]|nr:fluoride efflux transporter CrcB [Brevinematales bacterium]